MKLLRLLTWRKAKVNRPGMCKSRNPIERAQHSNKIALLASSSKIEPVNSLKTRMDSKEVFSDTWLTDLNIKYANISLDRTQQRAEEEVK